ncbi:MAG: metallophosphoesterase [Clostridia bacterium]|nr:metallophosphoesterase [Clostridia bacterium]
MTYVISDIHGNLEKFNEILEKIHFTDNDVMYVLGDIVDMGDSPMELLCDLSMRYNVIPVVGDHDLLAARLLGELDKVLRGGATPDSEIMGELTDWIRKGGAKTIEGFKNLDDDMKEGVLEYLEELSLYEEVEVKGKKYLLLHAGIADFDPDTPLEDYMPEDFVSEPLDPNRPYFDGVTVIAGHVPTYKMGGEKGKILYGDGSIFIDCGAAYGAALGCLRLEDGKEFYA